MGSIPISLFMKGTMNTPYEEFSQITYGKPYFHPYQFFTRNIRCLGPYGDINRRKEIKLAKRRNKINKMNNKLDKYNKSIWSEIIFISEMCLEECLHPIFYANFPESLPRNSIDGFQKTYPVFHWHDVEKDIVELLKQQLDIIEHICNINLLDYGENHIAYTKSFIRKVETNNET